MSLLTDNKQENDEYYNIIKKRAKETPEFRKIIQETKSRTIELADETKKKNKEK